VGKAPSTRGAAGGRPGRKVGGGPPPKTTLAATRARGTTPASPSQPKHRKATPTRRRTPGARALPAHAREVWLRLHALYPDAHCELDHRSAWQLLVATILSAQCTDKRVNQVTPVLFARYPHPGDLASAPPDAVEDIIRSTGFFRAKTRALIGVANALTERHHGHVPSRMEELVVLPGVGRKTANVVLGNAFHVNEGVVVDTHVARLAARLGLTSETDPVKIEQRLMELFPRDRWTLLSHLLIWHGRRICDARKPRCGECPLNDICPSSLV
jgi:endonuclease-3